MDSLSAGQWEDIPAAPAETATPSPQPAPDPAPPVAASHDDWEDITPAAPPRVSENPIYKAGESVTKYGEEKLPLTPEEKASLPGQVGSIMGGVIPAVAATLALGPAGALLGATQFGFSAAGETFEDAIKKGADDDTAAKAAGLSGAIAATIGSLPLGAVLAPIKQVAPGMVGWAAGKLAQATANGLVFSAVGEAQQYLLTEVEKAYYDKEAQYSPDLKRAMAGMIAGGAFGTMHPLEPAGSHPAAGQARPEIDARQKAADALAAMPPGSQTAIDVNGKPVEATPQAPEGGQHQASPEERESLRGMLDAGAPVAELAEHPMVQRALAENREAIASGNEWDFRDPNWRASRLYDFGGQEVMGWDNAVDRLTEQAKEFSTKAPAENGRRAVFVLGPPASGKSAISEPIARNMRAAIVDSDEAKKVIPEYRNGLGTQAVHEESSELAKDVLTNLVVDGTNIVLPKVGSDAKSIRRQMNLLKEAGYTVDIAHVAATPEIAGRRNISRFLKTGRLVDPDYITAVGDKPRETAYALRGEANDFADADTSKPNQYDVIEGTGPLADTLRDGRNGGLGPRAGASGSSQEAPGGPEGRREVFRGTDQGPVDYRPPEPESGKLISVANQVADEWQDKLGPDIKVVMGGSLVSHTYVRDEHKPVDMDIRFLTDNPERDYPKIEAATGLKLRKSRDVDDYPSGSSKAFLVEGPLTRDGVKFDVEGAVRSPAYVGWAKFYPSVMTPDELSAFRADKARLKGNEKGYKALKLAMLTEVKKRIEERGGPDAVAERGKITGEPVGAPHRVTAADGTSISVAPMVVEATALRTSQDAGYDQALQPRQRDRAASQAQVRDIATNLDPERLGYSSEADRGAPIVGPDGMVESGNGRVLALRSLYNDPALASQRDAYLAWLQQQGVDLSKYRRPVLVRQRTTDLTPDQRQHFTVAANQAATLAMSAPERAMTDAAHIDVGLIRNPDDLGAVANREMIRKFVSKLPQNEQGSLVDARGQLSSEGLTRIRNAVLAKAYDDDGLLSRIAESTDDEIKSISNALTAAAPEWAKLRESVKSGATRPGMDATPELMEAVRRTADLRGKGEKLDTHLAQQDAFERMAAPVEGFMRAFYDPAGRRALGTKRIADTLKFYAQEAAKVADEKGLDLGLVPIRAEDILLAKERADEAQRKLAERHGDSDGEGVEAGGREVRGLWLGEGGEGTGKEGAAGDQEAAQRSRPEDVEDEGVRAQRPKGPDLFDTMPLAGGKTGQQGVLPGTERLSPVEQAKRQAAAPIRPEKPQRPMDTGLFGERAHQTDLMEVLDALRGGPPGNEIRGGTPAVPAGQPPRRAPKATPVRQTDQLSLFGGPAGSGDVLRPDGEVSPQPGTQEAAALGTGESVTKPPTGGGGNRAPRPRDAAVEGVDEAQQKIAQRTRSNYRITPEDNIGGGNPRQKVRANLDAIKILKQIEEENRDATPAEKAVLVKYTGWGHIAQEMFDTFRERKAWEGERAELKALLTKEEYDTARASTPNAHYTSPEVVSGMWDALDHMGYAGGMALEPSAGVGHFMGLIPDKMAPKTAWTAVELDKISGRITKALYGNAETNIHGFEDLKRPSNYYDLAISNVPFGDYQLKEAGYGSYPIHNFFFVKSLDKVRPGGVVAFITSSFSMDAGKHAGWRRELGKTSDLIGAIRLPGGDKGAFAKNAGTQVTTDIIFLRKKVPGEAPFAGHDWAGRTEIQTPEGPHRINEYFAKNPHMMLGEMRLIGSQYRANEPVLIGDAENIRERIAAAAQQMQADAMSPRLTPKPPTISGEEAAGVKDGSFFLKGGALYQRREGVGHAHPLSETDHDKVTRLIGMRDAYNDLIGAQLHGKGDANALRSTLRDAYKSFVDKYGPINKEVRTVTARLTKAGDPVVITKRPNFRMFESDPDAYKVASIENYDPETDRAKAADIQTKDVLNAPMEREINGPSDALAASLQDKGGVDLDHIARSLGMGTQEEAIKALGDSIYQNPNGRQWETPDEYLSGDVVKKLEEAKAIAGEDRSYMRNVAALEKVQPEPLLPHEITAQFGAHWIPVDVYESFLKSIGGRDGRVDRTPITGDLKVSKWFFDREAYTKYGNLEYDLGAGRKGNYTIEPSEVAQAALTNQQITIWDKHADGSRSVNTGATEQARVKTDLMKEAFTGDADRGVDGWVWSDPERSDRLAGIYNRTNNNLVDAKWDGSHLTFPGLNPKFADRQHRKDAVWRVIKSGNTLLAHVVGSGKSATMYASSMEQKRLGLINKPAHVIPNHMLEQYSREFVEAYPNAKLLVAQKDEMTAANRRAFMAKVASNDWDAVIFTHDAFGRINLSKERREAHIRDQLDEYEKVIKAEQADDKRSPTVKQLEKGKKRLQKKLDELMNEDRKDAGTNFEESGIDFLFVDEAHLFKNLSFMTKLNRVKGMAQGDAQRAEDLFLKTRYLDEKRPGRSAVFATGTPVSNTIAEIWTMMRYLEHDALKERGLENFDSWANTFGQVTTNMELGADGRTMQPVSSFSKFVNVPELVSLYARIADTKTAEMLNLPRPEVETRGKKGISIVEAEPSQQEETFIQGLVNLAASIKGKRVEPGQPNMASIATAGRKVAADGRLVGKTTTDQAVLAANPSIREHGFEYNPNGKIGKAVAQMARVYREGNADPSRPDKVQMVFLDLGTPSAKGKKLVTGNEGEAEAKFNLYADIKQRLIDEGIPAHEIASIHEATDDDKKARLFSKVRSGAVRFLLGSTSKMGMGTNVQNKLIAMHHIDAPWKPSEVEQRDGRIIRQGNENDKVQIYRYVTKRSFDAFMWQTLERKAKFLAQLLSGARGSRTVEDVDSPLPEAAEMKAAASGDPRILEHAELDRQVRQLTAQRRNFEGTKARSTWEVGNAKSQAQQIETALPDARADAGMVTDISGDKFKVDLGGEVTERKAAGEKILLRLLEETQAGHLYRPVVVNAGKMSGFDMQIEMRSGWDGDGQTIAATLSLRGKNAYSSPNDVTINEKTDPAGLIRRFENILAAAKTRPSSLETQLKGEQESIKRLEKTAGEKWSREADYHTAVEKLHALEKALQAPKMEAEPEGEAEAPDAEKALRAPTGDVPEGRAIKIANTEAYTRKYTAKEQELANTIADIGDRLAPQANIRGASALRQNGQKIWAGFINSKAFPQLIMWSLERGDPAKTVGGVRHEIVHHLKNAGLIRPDEWKALASAAVDRDWLKKHDIPERYGDLSHDNQVEEAVAEEYSEWRKERAIEKPGPIRDAFMRLDLFMKRIAAAARKTFGAKATAEDVFTRMETGEVGRRTRSRADGGAVDDLPVMVDPLAGKRSIGERPDVQAAVKDYATAALDPLISVSRVITGNSQEPFQDIGRAMLGSVMPPVGGALRPLAAVAGKGFAKAVQSAAHDVKPTVIGRAMGGRVMAHYIDANPTEAQRASGNYRKAHISLHGLEIAIENARGGFRHGVGKDGKEWKVRLPAHYGYIKRTEGADGDHVDCYIGPHTTSRKVFVIDQQEHESRRFDEHKCMLGFGSLEQARNTYIRGFSDGHGRERIGRISEMDIDQFKDWLKHGDTTKPLDALTA